MIFLIVENEPRIKLLHQKEGPRKAGHSLRETPRAAAVSSLASDGETQCLLSDGQVPGASTLFMITLIHETVFMTNE